MYKSINRKSQVLWELLIFYELIVISITNFSLVYCIYSIAAHLTLTTSNPHTVYYITVHL